MYRLLALLLASSAPLAAEAPAPREGGVREFPQPVLLDWGDQFRLNAPPKNGRQAALDHAKAAEDARLRTAEPAAPSSPAVAAIGPPDPTRTRWTNRPIAPDETMLNLQAPVASGPVSLGATYGRYRAVPTTREISAHDARVSLGIAF